MDVVSDDAKVEFRRIEVLTGPVRRRRWSAEEKGRIVAETLQVGASVMEVARRWQVCPQQVWGWRREAREGHLTLPADAGGSTETPKFVPIVTAERPLLPETNQIDPGAGGAGGPAPTPSIEIRLAGAVVRVTIGADVALLTDVLRAVRTSAR
jgi:transposase